MYRRLMILVVIALSLSVLIVACTKTEGQPFDLNDKAQLEALGYVSCDKDKDCEPFGYCGEDGFCQYECRDDPDCNLFQNGDDDLICHNYRCMREDQIPTEDGDVIDGDSDADGEIMCEPVVTEDMDCVYRPDTGADSCESLGWNMSCGNSFCVQAGYNYSCGESNKCVKGCDVDNGDTETLQNSADYVGVWGGVYSTAVRNDDMPLVGYQDTVSIHHTITRAFVRDAKLYFHHKTCNLVISNFKGDKLFYDKDLAYMVVPEAYFKSVPVVEHFVAAPPKFEAGAKFDTSRAWECRGVKMDDCTNLDDPIPGREEHEAGDTRIWDQDYDGKPAMTSVMAGVLNGEVYSVQRWSTVFEAEVVDTDRIWGINNHTNEQHNIDATSAALLTKITTIPHADHDRSFYRLFRMDENATCEDVLKLAEEEGHWLYFTPHKDPETVLDLGDD